MSGFPADNAVLVETTIKQERGRWVVYLSVTFWEGDDSANPLRTVEYRIQDYATERQAAIAANLIRRCANRDLKSPPLGY